MKSFLENHARRIVAILLIVALYWVARLPGLSGSERAVLATRFRFERQPLPELAGYPQRSVRAVHPSLEHISAWISSVGAAVALGDIDGDRLPNDVCYVDPRTDLVIVAPVPGTSKRYKPFALNPAPLPYDPATMAPMGSLMGDWNEDGLTDILVYYWGRTPVIFLRKGEWESGKVGEWESGRVWGYGSKGERGKAKGESLKPEALTINHQPLTINHYIPCEVMPKVERWYTNAATQADLDGDGHVDLIIGNYFQDGARILDAKATGRESMQHSMSRAYNAGRNRLLLWANGRSGSKPGVEFKDASDALEEEVAHGWTLAVGAADLDGDLLPEIYFANDFGPDRLLYNQSKIGHLKFILLKGVKTLTTPNSKALGRDSFKGMGCDFGDLNGDGLLDIYVSNIAAEWSLQESHFAWVSTGEIRRMKEGIAPYVDRGEPLGLSRSGWGWESRLADFDNDGVLEAIQATGFIKGEINRWPELHEVATGNDELLSNPRMWHRFEPGDELSGHQHNPFFVRASNGRYFDIAEDLGLSDPMVSRGIATADVDGDGKLDFAVANQWETSYFYHNRSLYSDAFLGLRLLLPIQNGRTGEWESGRKMPNTQHPTPKPEPRSPNPEIRGRPAIGAQATIYLPDGHKLVAQVDGGNGHSGKRSQDLHFGLGQIAPNLKLRIELRWRDSSGQVHQGTIYLTPGWHTVLLGPSPDGNKGERAKAKGESPKPQALKPETRNPKPETRGRRLAS